MFAVVTFTQCTLTTNLFVKDIQSLGNIVQIFHVHCKRFGLRPSLTKFSLESIDVLKRVEK